MDRKKKKYMERLWAELLADMFGNDVFAEVLEERRSYDDDFVDDGHDRTPVGQYALGKPLGLGNKKVIGEAVNDVGSNSFTVSPVVFDETKLDPEISDDELKEMEEENERKEKD
jgi:hypothetical protein